MTLHQQLYEINTRAWLYSLKKKFKKDFTLSAIPESAWEDIIEKRFDWIWLMGVWEHSQLHQEDVMRNPGLLKEIQYALPEWESKDIIGSPYSIVKYDLNPILGQKNDLITLRKKLNDYGISLMLDFVPNHFGIHSMFPITNPEYFISQSSVPTDKSLFKHIKTTDGTLWIAHGKDPYFPPWGDTYQLNYFNETTADFMIENLSHIADLCDGVRCDMAMLCLNDVINSTWGHYFKDNEITSPKTEFWAEAIEFIKSKYPDFIFLGEVYWGLEWTLQQLGFDFTYDKVLYDRLIWDPPDFIRDHLKADLEYQKKSLRFIENHDEARAIETFGLERSIAAAVIMGTVPGLSLYHQGQFEGEKIKIPLQLIRKQQEQPNLEIQELYERLLTFTDQEIIKNGQWSLLETLPINSSDNTWHNILAWQWSTPEMESNQISLIAVNYSRIQSQGRIFFMWANKFKDVDHLVFEDIMIRKTNVIDKTELKKKGLEIILKPFQSHLFNIVDN